MIIYVNTNADISRSPREFRMGELAYNVGLNKGDEYNVPGNLYTRQNIRKAIRMAIERNASSGVI